MPRLAMGTGEESLVERWRERERKRRESCRHLPLPPWYNRLPSGFCRWCAGEIPMPDRRERRWHPDCVAEFHFCRNPAGSRAILNKTMGRCAGCRIQIVTWQSDGRHKGAGDSVCWARQPEWSPLLADGPWCGVDWTAKPWNADHIVPLWSVERAGLRWRELIKFWQLPNLQALCERCHKAKTRVEAGQRAESRRPQIALAL